MSAAYGVHFGCTSACLAVNKDEKTDVVANDLGDRTTPCIVAFTDHDQAVGSAAKQGMIRNLQNTVCHVKQILGRKCDAAGVPEYRRNSSATVIDKGGEPMYEVDYKESRKMFTPSQITVLIYKKMLETAQSHGGSGIQESVLAVPLHFTEEQKRILSAAATQAGFNILRLISEPTAAVMAYDIGQTDATQNSRVLVFRLGGVTADVSVVNVLNGMYQISSCVVDNTLGGDKFTKQLSNQLIAEFKRTNRCDITDNKRSVAKMDRAAENCKHTMSKLDNVHIAIDSLYEGMDFNTKVSRARLASGVNELLQQCVKLIEQALAEGNCTTADINKVILCGGGSNMPLVQKIVCDMFVGSEILNTLCPEEVIAIGAAKQAGILVGLEDDDIRLNAADNHVDCIAKAICIKTCTQNGPTYSPVFQKLSPLHSRKHIDFIMEESQTSFLLEICEVDSITNPTEVTTIAKIVMRELPKSSTINSTFHLRRDGHLHVTCTEPTSNKTESITAEGS